MTNLIPNETTLGYMRTRQVSDVQVYVDPAPPVFKAKVASVPTGDTYLQVAYDTVSEGVYTDIKIGQTLIFSTTADYTDVYWEGRVADTPTDTLIPINESYADITTDIFMTVLDTYREGPKPRKGSLVDGRHAYENLPPAIENLRSVYLINSTGTGSLALSPIGRAMAYGATVDPDEGHAWDFPGTVTYGVGDASSREIEITVPHGHTWGRHTATDSNGVSHWMVFEIIVQNPNAPTLAFPADKLKVNRTLSGHHATITTYKAATRAHIMDNARVVVVSKTVFAGGDPGLDPVVFVGYTTKDSSNSSSPRDKSVVFELAGIWERAGSVTTPQIAIRDEDAPAEWDHMTWPTTPRASWHLIVRYSMVAHLCSFNFFTAAEAAAPQRWYTGHMNISPTSLADAIEQVASEIKAHLLGNPSGEMFLRRSASYQTTDERDALDTIATLTNRDIRSLGLERPHTQQVGRILMGFRSFRTTSDLSKGGRAAAPAVILGSSPETREVGNQLMRADQSDGEVLAEARQRAGDLYAAANAPYTFPTMTLRDGFFSWTPSVSQWLNLTLASTDTVRGVPLTAVRTLLASVELDYDTRRKTWSVSIEPIPETRGGAALIVASLTPAVQELDMRVVAIQSAYAGWDMPASANLGTLDDPDRTFARGNMGGMGFPMPSDLSGEEGMRNPPRGTAVTTLTFSTTDNVNSGYIAESGEDYEIVAAGSATVGTLTGEVPYDFTAGDEGWTPTVANYADYIPGEGWYRGTLDPLSMGIQLDLSGIHITRVTVTCSHVVTQCYAYEYYAGANIQLAPAQNTGPSFDFTVDTIDGLYIGITHLFGFPTDFRITNITIYTDEPVDTGRSVDSFYSYRVGDDGKPTDWALLGSEAGLFFDNVPITVPSEPSPDHIYRFTFPGTGNVIAQRWERGPYRDVQVKPLFVQATGQGIDE